MKDPLAPLSADARRKLRKQKHPAWIQPMLATLTDHPFSDEGWIFEPKLDGVRCLAFRSRERKTPPFADSERIPRKRVHWASPKLVAEVGFTEWTSDGKLRHPRFLGLRGDKVPKDVVREKPR